MQFSSQACHTHDFVPAAPLDLLRRQGYITLKSVQQTCAFWIGLLVYSLLHTERQVKPKRS